MTQYTFFGQSIEATRVNNDSNGNPRYVIHFLPIKAFLESKGVVFKTLFNRKRQTGD